MSIEAAEKYGEWKRAWDAIERSREERNIIRNNPMFAAADAFLAGWAAREGDLVIFRSQLDYSMKVIDQLWRDVELARVSGAKAAEHNSTYTAENVKLRREIERLRAKLAQAKEAKL